MPRVTRKCVSRVIRGRGPYSNERVGIEMGVERLMRYGYRNDDQVCMVLGSNLGSEWALNQ